MQPQPSLTTMWADRPDGSTGQASNDECGGGQSKHPIGEQASGRAARRRSLPQSPRPRGASGNPHLVGVPRRRVRLQGQEAGRAAVRRLRHPRAAAGVLRRGGAGQPSPCPSVYYGVVSLVPRGPTKLAVAPEHDPRAVEYAVEMRRYDEDATLAARLAHGRAGAADVGAVGARLARFHAGLAPDASGDATDRLADVVEETLSTLARVAAGAVEPARLTALARFARAATGGFGPRAASARGGRAGARRPRRSARGAHPAHRAAGSRGCHRVRPLAAHRRRRLRPRVPRDGRRPSPRVARAYARQRIHERGR